AGSRRELRPMSHARADSWQRVNVSDRLPGQSPLPVGGKLAGVKRGPLRNKGGGASRQRAGKDRAVERDLGPEVAVDGVEVRRRVLSADVHVDRDAIEGRDPRHRATLTTG